MTREETIEAIRAATWDDGLISADEATAIYDQFIAPLERERGQWQRQAQDQLVRAEALEDYVERNDYIGGWRKRAEAAEAARDEALALLAEVQPFIGGWRASDEIIAKVAAALAPVVRRGDE